MNGDDLLALLAARLSERDGVKKLSEARLASALGITTATLSNYRNKELTPRQIDNLIQSYANAELDRFVDLSVDPIAEFMPIERCPTNQNKSWRIFSTVRSDKKNRYLIALKQKLEESHGIYIFHDSRGRAIYVGKANYLDLWTEINNAFNRDRKEVQSIKRIYHPIGKGVFAARERQITKNVVPLHHIASYFSAYAVPEALIGKFEALLVRGFANDLLNVRMEHF